MYNPLAYELSMYTFQVINHDDNILYSRKYLRGMSGLQFSKCEVSTSVLTCVAGVSVSHKPCLCCATVLLPPPGSVPSLTPELSVRSTRESPVFVKRLAWCPNDGELPTLATLQRFVHA